MARKSSSEQQPRRVKVTLACVVCRKKKVKCDGVQPTCGRCRSNGFSCAYSDPPKKRGPPKGHGEIIETRAQRIRSLLDNPSSFNSWTTTHNGNNAAATAAECSSFTPPGSMNEIFRLATDAVHNTKPGSHGNFLDFSCPSHDDEDSIISSELASIWAESYFAHFNVFFPILSRQHFLFHLVHNRHAIEPLLRYAVYALGCRYLNPQDRAAQMWFDKCERILSACDTPTLSMVQSLVIMCWYAYLSGDVHVCCGLRSQLAYRVQELQLGQEWPCFGTVEQEMRRRALWVSYVVDQWLAVCTGERHMSAYTNWTCKFPKLEDGQLYAIDVLQSSLLFEQQHHNEQLTVESALQVAAFSEMIKLARIVGSAHEELYYAKRTMEPAALEKSLTEWLLNLPHYLEFDKATEERPPSPIVRVFHMLYYTAKIMLRQSPREEWTASICTAAANTIVHIAEEMVRHNQTRYLYNVFGLSLTLATSVHLGNARCSSLPALGKSVRVLRETNSTLLGPVEFERLLIDRCGLVLEEEEDPSASGPRQNNTKRPRLADDQQKRRPAFEYSRPLRPEQFDTTENNNNESFQFWLQSSTIAQQQQPPPPPSCSSTDGSPTSTLATTPIESFGSPSPYFSSPHMPIEYSLLPKHDDLSSIVCQDFQLGF